MFDDFDDLKTKNPEVLRETKHMFCWVNVMSFLVFLCFWCCFLFVVLIFFSGGCYGRGVCFWYFFWREGLFKLL